MRAAINVNSKRNKKRTKDMTKAICKVLETISKHRITDNVGIQALRVLESEAHSNITIQNCRFHNES